MGQGGDGSARGKHLKPHHADAHRRDAGPPTRKADSSILMCERYHPGETAIVGRLDNGSNKSFWFARKTNRTYVANNYVLLDKRAGNNVARGCVTR